MPPKVLYGFYNSCRVEVLYNLFEFLIAVKLPWQFSPRKFFKNYGPIGMDSGIFSLVKNGVCGKG